MILQGLYRYPLKSGAAQSLEQVQLDTLGLQGDRSWLLTDPQGRFVTARDYPQLSMVHSQGSRFFFVDSLSPVAQVDALGDVSIWKREQPAKRAADDINAWFSQIVQAPVVLWHLSGQDAQHFGDSNPVMVLFQSTVDAMTQALGEEFPALQFRPNLLLSGAPAFSEGSQDTLQIGQVTLKAIEPCTRCKMINLPPESDHYPMPMRVAPALRRLSPDFVAGHHYQVMQSGSLALGDACS